MKICRFRSTPVSLLARWAQRNLSYWRFSYAEDLPGFRNVTPKSATLNDRSTNPFDKTSSVESLNWAEAKSQKNGKVPRST